jgi:hypothetical protein
MLLAFVLGYLIGAWRTQFSVPGFPGDLFGWGLSPLASDFLKKKPGKAASRRSSVDRAAHGSTVAFVVIVHSVAPSEPVVLP